MPKRTIPSRSHSIGPPGSGSRFPEFLGLLLIGEVFAEDPNGLLAFISEDARDEDFSDDFSFLTWLRREFRKDPALLSRVRRVVKNARSDYIHAARAEKQPGESKKE